VQVSHTPAALSASFDDPSLVSTAGLVPIMRLADSAGLHSLADERLTITGDKGANSGRKINSLVAGMIAGADSIDDMQLLRHGGMGRLFDHPYAPSTLGSFLRAFTFGHVRQLDAIASRFLNCLAARADILPISGDDGVVFVDVDDTIVEVHGYAKQASGYGYSGIRGLNALLATATTADSVPVISGQRLRKGAANSARGAQHLISTSLATLGRMAPHRRVLVRADSAFYGYATVAAARAAGADVSVTVRLDPAVKRAISSIPAAAWTPIEYTDAIYDETTGTWVSRAEVAEISFTAFSSRKKTQRVPGRLVVRRIPDFNPADQDELFAVYRHHAFFTTTSADVHDTVTADKIHRGHAVIEQVHADLKNSALAHLPSGKFAANSAWLVLAVIAYNLTRAAGVLAGGHATRARTATIRTTLVHVAARITTSARKTRLRLPVNWPWQTAWQRLFTAANAPPVTV